MNATYHAMNALTPEDRDLLTRVLPRLTSPGIIQCVADALLTGTYYEWDKIYWTMRSEMYNLGGYKSLKQIVEHYENTKPNPESL